MLSMSNIFDQINVSLAISVLGHRAFFVPDLVIT
jgi:hypothetical protein